MESMVSAVLQQLLMQTPMLLVCLVGLILALVLCARCPAAGILLLCGTGLLLLTSVAWPLIWQYVIRSFAPERLGGILPGISLASSALHAAGIGLIIAAAFVGRRPRVTS